VTLIGRNNDTKPTADNTGNEGSNDVLDGTINRPHDSATQAATDQIVADNDNMNDMA